MVLPTTQSCFQAFCQPGSVFWKIFAVTLKSQAKAVKQPLCAFLLESVLLMLSTSVSGFSWASPLLSPPWSSSPFAWVLEVVLAPSASSHTWSCPLSVLCPGPTAATRSPLANLLSVTHPCHLQPQKATQMPPATAGLCGDNIRLLSCPPLKQIGQRAHHSSIVPCN